MLKWFIGALLATNGGALVSLINMEVSRPGIVAESAFPFAAGLVLSLFAGFLWAFAAAGFARDFTNELWSGKVLEEHDLNGFRSRSKNGNIPAAIAMVFLLLAALALIVGSYEFANDLKVLSSKI